MDKISHDLINNFVSDYDIFSYYIGSRFTVNKVFNSPLREDNNPSFGIFKAADGKLMFNDFSTSDSGDVFKFVRLKCNLRGFREALERVYDDMVVQGHRAIKSEIEPVNSLKRGSKEISVKRRKWSKIDDEYWGQFNLTKEILDKYEVSPVEFMFVDGDIYWIHDDENPIYVYKVYDKLKVYRPKAVKRNKWRGSLTRSHIMGYKQLPENGDLLIITKSLKDVMCLDILGYNAISPASEGTSVPEKVMSILKERFKEIIVFYDNDEAGIKGAKKICDKYNLKSIMIPDNYNAKDISDAIKMYGTDKVNKLMYDLQDGLKEAKENEEISPV